ncbi:hypothetical protein AABB24_015698, partial [Solanum stoloniferum]
QNHTTLPHRLKLLLFPRSDASPSPSSFFPKRFAPFPGLPKKTAVDRRKATISGGLQHHPPRRPSIIAPSYQLYIPSIIFYEPKQTSKALPPALLRLKKAKGMKNHRIWG